MTLSIAAWDETTNQLGAAIASSSISVASRCLHWQSGVGIALSQNITDPRLGPRMLSLLSDGLGVDDTLDRVVQDTAHIRFRQLALLDNSGNSGHFSGEGTLGCHAAAQRKHCVAAGNLLDNERVPTAMVDAMQQRSGSFGTRLLGALLAGVEAGGEVDALHSAAMLIGGEMSWPLVELRIDWDQQPIEKMVEGWKVYEPQIDAYVTRALQPDEAPSYGVAGDP